MNEMLAKHYIEIGQDQYKLDLDRGRESFTTRDRDIITTLIKAYKLTINAPIFIDDSNSKFSTKIVRDSTITADLINPGNREPRNNKSLYFKKGLDDYYYVCIVLEISRSVRYYKCDQLNGLKQCIIDNFY
jgi:hypothetical protein